MTALERFFVRGQKRVYALLVGFRAKIIKMKFEGTKRALISQSFNEIGPLVFELRTSLVSGQKRRLRPSRWIYSKDH